MQKNFSSKQIEKIENIFDDLLKEVKNESIQEKIEEKEILPQKPLEKVKEIVSEEREKKPLEKVRLIVSKLDEREQALLGQKVGLVAGGVGENEYKEIQKNFSLEQIEKIENIVSENISSDIKPGAIVDGKINANVFADLLKKVNSEPLKEKTEVKTKDNFQSILADEKKAIAKEKFKDTSKQKKVEFSMNGVKEIDKKIKEEQKDTSKEKQQKQTISR